MSNSGDSGSSLASAKRWPRFRLLPCTCPLEAPRCSASQSQTVARPQGFVACQHVSCVWYLLHCWYIRGAPRTPQRWTLPTKIALFFAKPETSDCLWLARMVIVLRVSADYQVSAPTPSLSAVTRLRPGFDPHRLHTLSFLGVRAGGHYEQ